MVRGMEQVFDRAVEGSTHFAKMLESVRDLALGEQDKAHDPQLIADVVHEALTARRPKIASSVEPDLTRSILSHLPDRLVDRLLKAVLGRR